MSGLPAGVQRYLDKHAGAGPWSLGGAACGGVHGAVVIPSLAEGGRLFKTLQSLSANPPPWTRQFLVVVVVNNASQASPAERRQNRLDLADLARLTGNTGLSLAWVDAASPGLEVPDRQAGVGFARKLGMDLALPRLDWGDDPLLVCLDADTLVEANYLEAIVAHFRRATRGAAVLAYRHQPADSPVRQAAIDRYELFLRSYVYGLQLAGSPYAFNSMGSAMACRGSAYVRCGGMNCRKAGEDFYFLQKLAKTDGVARLPATTVFPEPRVSARVPFGTGRSMTRLLDGDPRAVLFYPAAAFRVLADWLTAAHDNLGDDAGTLFARAEQISPVLAGYLEQSGWHEAWPRLQSTHQAAGKRAQAFHAWFDGFRTMRLLHLLCDAGFGRHEPLEVLPEYFAWAGEPCPETLPGMLAVLRREDRASSQISLSKIC